MKLIHQIQMYGIEFSVPDKAFENLSTLINNRNKVISGTTGWTERYKEIVKLTNEKKLLFYMPLILVLGQYIPLLSIKIGGAHGKARQL